MRRDVLGMCCVLAAMGCTHEESCATRPTDPLCQEVDGATADGGADANVDAATVDAHAPCGGACNGTTPHCDTASDTCVACLTDDHCTDPDASVCGTQHTCEACATSADCTHLTATPVCDTAAMSCVECLTNEDCAATEGCDAETHACVTFTPDSVDTCGACTRDAECHAGQLCVPMTYDDPTTAAADPVPTGNRCLWRQDAAGTGAPNGDCFTNQRPYVRASTLTSVDGVSAMVCTLRVSTCEAQANFSMLDCMSLDATGDARCGLPSVHDGVCRMVSASANRCTAFCGSDDDCPGGFTCDNAASPRVCHF